MVRIHEDGPLNGGELMEESADPLQESGQTRMSDSEEEVEDIVAEDITRFEASFRGINSKYRLINRIGEGMEHIVYKWAPSC